MLLHRYFRHGPVAERLVRWAISLGVAWIAQRLVRKAFS